MSEGQEGPSVSEQEQPQSIWRKKMGRRGFLKFLGAVGTTATLAAVTSGWPSGEGVQAQVAESAAQPEATRLASVAGELVSPEWPHPLVGSDQVVAAEVLDASVENPLFTIDSVKLQDFRKQPIPDTGDPLNRHDAAFAEYAIHCDSVFSPEGTGELIIKAESVSLASIDHPQLKNSLTVPADAFRNPSSFFSHLREQTGISDQELQTMRYTFSDADWAAFEQAINSKTVLKHLSVPLPNGRETHLYYLESADSRVSTNMFPQALIAPGTLTESPLETEPDITIKKYRADLDAIVQNLANVYRFVGDPEVYANIGIEESQHGLPVHIAPDLVTVISGRNRVNALAGPITENIAEYAHQACKQLFTTLSVRDNVTYDELYDVINGLNVNELYSSRVKNSLYQLLESYDGTPEEKAAHFLEVFKSISADRPVTLPVGMFGASINASMDPVLSMGLTAAGLHEEQHVILKPSLLSNSDQEALPEVARISGYVNGVARRVDQLRSAMEQHGGFNDTELAEFRTNISSSLSPELTAKLQMLPPQMYQEYVSTKAEIDEANNLIRSHLIHFFTLPGIAHNFFNTYHLSTFWTYLAKGAEKMGSIPRWTDIQPQIIKAAYKNRPEVTIDTPSTISNYHVSTPELVSQLQQDVGLPESTYVDVMTEYFHTLALKKLPFQRHKTDDTTDHIVAGITPESVFENMRRRNGEQIRIPALPKDDSQENPLSWGAGLYTIPEAGPEGFTLQLSEDMSHFTLYAAFPESGQVVDLAFYMNDTYYDPQTGTLDIGRIFTELQASGQVNIGQEYSMLCLNTYTSGTPYRIDKTVNDYVNWEYALMQVNYTEPAEPTPTATSTSFPLTAPATTVASATPSVTPTAMSGEQPSTPTQTVQPEPSQTPQQTPEVTLQAPTATPTATEQQIPTETAPTQTPTATSTTTPTETPRATEAPPGPYKVYGPLIFNYS